MVLKQRPDYSNSPLFLFGAYSVLYILWPSNYITIRMGLESMPPFIMGGLRFTISGILLYWISILAGNKVLGLKRSWVAMKQGLLLNVGGTGALIWAEQYVESGIAAVVFSTIPLYIILIDTPEWRNNFSKPSTLIGVLIGIAAVIVLFGLNKLSLDPHFLTGFLVLLFGCLSWSLGTIYVKYAGQSIPIVTKLAIHMLTAGVCLGLFGSLSGELSSFDLSKVTAVSWIGLAIQIFIGSIAGYLAFIWLLKVRPALEVSTYTFVHPCVAIILGVVIGDERLGPKVYYSLALILIAIYFIRYHQKIAWSSLKSRVVSHFKNFNN